MLWPSPMIDGSESDGATIETACAPVDRDRSAEGDVNASEEVASESNMSMDREKGREDWGDRRRLEHLPGSHDHTAFTVHFWGIPISFTHQWQVAGRREGSAHVSRIAMFRFFFLSPCLS